MMIAVVLGFLLCYFSIHWLETGGKILTKQERVINNYLWNAQVHDKSVFFVHIRDSYRFKEEANKRRQKTNFSDYTAKLARDILSFADDGFWTPYRERFDIDFTTFKSRDYIAFSVAANFTMPEEDFFARHQ